MDEKKGFLSSVFNARNITVFFATTVASWILMFPLDVWADAGRSVFVHSVGAEPLVNSAWGVLEPVYDALGFTDEDGLLGGVVADATAEQTAALTPDAQAVEELVEEEAFSANDMFGPQ